MENNEEVRDTEAANEEPEIIDAPKADDELLAAEKERYLRLAAEYANYKNRTRTELDMRYGDGKVDAIRAILPVWDNLERALKQETTDPAYKQGVELIMRQLCEIFEKLGVSAIVSEPGTDFNPELHDAIAHVEDESLGQNVIAEVFQRGFMLGDKVIRHSLVRAAN